MSSSIRATFSLAILIISLSHSSCTESGENDQSPDPPSTTPVITKIHHKQHSTHQAFSHKSIETNPSVESHSNATAEEMDDSVFGPCILSECQLVCGSHSGKIAKCDPTNKKLCMCAISRFLSSSVPGKLEAVSKVDPISNACNNQCSSREGYSRLWLKPDGTKHCICLSSQKTKTGITLCDIFAVEDECKRICQSEDAACTFDGACDCRRNWSSFFNLSIPNVRKELPTDAAECDHRCLMYHHDFVPRIYDPKMLDLSTHKVYGFKTKYCLCGPDEFTNSYPQTKEIIEAGFQVCTGLKCKQRCGMREAVCEPTYRRACLCRRPNIFIGPHLWARLPSNSEKFCQDACFAQGLQSRIIEKNPLLNPASQRWLPLYRKSLFQYQYDGKFCHCIKVDLDMDDFRPCTDELCQWLCGHDDAICDLGTRRNCMCNTHKPISSIGRNTSPGEVSCNIACRHHIQEAKIIDMAWETKSMDGWGVTKSKFCLCIRPVTPAGLTHCDGMHDICPQLCNSTDAYCTRNKYCECGVAHNLLNNGTIRLPTGKENDECGEKCRSWLWPLAEDKDSHPLIFDESRVNCSRTNSCPHVDTTPWSLTRPGAVEHGAKEGSHEKKYCLCAKTVTIHYDPGMRFAPHMEPHRDPRKMECIGNHTCTNIANTIHVKV